MIALIAFLSSCGQTTNIDWVDFVKLNDTSYESDGSVVPDEYVGEKVGEVTGNVPNEIKGSYKGNIEKNGDAAFLPVGTELFAVSGYSSDEYVAALVDGEYKLYKTRESKELPIAVETENDGIVTDGSQNKPDQTSGGGTSSDGTTGGMTDNGTTSGTSTTKKGDASFDSEVINYVRTYGDVGSYIPGGVIICSETELMSYYKSKGSVSSFDSTGSLRDAFSNYGAPFFKNKCVAVIDLEETSGSNRHEVTGTVSKAGTLTISIKRIVPEIGTTDMAHWYILIPVERASYSSLKVVLDGKEYKLNPSVQNPGKGENMIEPVIEEVSSGTASAPPNLGLQTQKGDSVSYMPATMGGTYSWRVAAPGGSTDSIEADGQMPYEIKGITKMKYGETDGGVLLVTSGKVEKMTVKRYSENYWGAGNGENVKVSKSMFTLKGGSYYEITVVYEQGTAVYGFICGTK